MGYTVQRGSKAAYCATPEDVMGMLKELNWGEIPVYVNTSPGGIRYYSDQLHKLISVIPDSSSDILQTTPDLEVQ